MPSAFLSHNSRDKPFVRQLAEELANNDVVVWLDEADLEIGDSLVSKISAAIRDVDFVIVAISAHSVESPWVEKEISLGMSKEIAAGAVAVLPILLDDSEMPPQLADKLYADFRAPERFELELGRLLRAMGVSETEPTKTQGLAVEWTPEGPRVSGYRAALSPTEANALLNRWFESFDELLPQEKEKRGYDSEDAWGAARVGATIKACEAMYLQTIYEEDLRELTSELGRKANLFFVFMENLHYEHYSESEGAA